MGQEGELPQCLWRRRSRLAEHLEYQLWGSDSYQHRGAAALKGPVPQSGLRAVEVSFLFNLH